MERVVNGMQIAGRAIGHDQPCFVIGEAGVNHNGSVDVAFQLVDAAVRAGVDAVKFQTFVADRLASPTAPKAAYQLRTTDRGESQLDMLRRLELSPDAHRDLIAYCDDRGILFLSTPFDAVSVELLDNLGVPAFKIGSGDLTNLPLLADIARKRKPVILSTGMATMPDVEQALRTLRAHGADEIAALHCVSCYPARAADVNLRAIATMCDVLRVPVGYSDHTEGIEIAIAAVALGACILEKHFTVDRSLPGPDHPLSLEPDELVSLVRAIRAVEAARGHGRKEPAASEADVAAVARKSLVAAADIPCGTSLTEPLLASVRPGTGLPPAMLSELIGRRTNRRIPAGTQLALEMLV